MARPGPQTFAKRQREIAKREKKRLKREKMAARKAQKKLESEQDPDLEAQVEDNNDDPDIDWSVRASMLGTDADE